MIWPLDSFTITQVFSAAHQANDLAAPQGTSVVAPTRGYIDGIGTNPNYIGGLFVTMKGDNGYRYYMGHLSKYFVSKGQVIKEGAVVGQVGMTGQATGPHVHYQIWNPSGSLVDPSIVMSNQGGSGMVSIPEWEYEDLKKWKDVFQKVSYSPLWAQAGGKGGSADVDASAAFNAIIEDDLKYSSWVKNDPDWGGADLSTLDVVPKGATDNAQVLKPGKYIVK